MPRFIDTQQFTYLEIHETIALTTNHGVNGTLAIEVFDGLEYVLVDSVVDSGSRELFVRGLTIRFTPASGMAYSVAVGR